MLMIVPSGMLALMRAIFLCMLFLIAVYLVVELLINKNKDAFVTLEILLVIGAFIGLFVWAGHQYFAELDQRHGPGAKK